ncbi:MAG: hypothetical protein C5B60_07530 [Chloroflexi bacterium]|nr:MAG: hypothetical protein C5B60_07530 [Chloroflexota bacterium]
MNTQRFIARWIARAPYPMNYRTIQREFATAEEAIAAIRLPFGPDVKNAYVVDTTKYDEIDRAVRHVGYRKHTIIAERKRKQEVKLLTA